MYRESCTLYDRIGWEEETHVCVEAHVAGTDHGGSEVFNPPFQFAAIFRALGVTYLLSQYLGVSRAFAVTPSICGYLPATQ